jgi:hypothetical protein
MLLKSSQRPSQLNAPNLAFEATCAKSRAGASTLRSLMVLKLLSLALGSVLALPVRVGAGCLRQVSSGLRLPGLAGVSLSWPTRLFNHFCHAVRVFPLSFPPSSLSLWGLGCMLLPFPPAFPANRSNITIHRTSGKLRLPASGDFQRWASQ